MITISGTKDCVQCTAVGRFLDTRHIPHTFIDLNENATKLAELKAAGIQQIPVVETPTERFTGFNPARLDAAVAEFQGSVATQSVVASAPGRVVA